MGGGEKTFCNASNWIKEESYLNEFLTQGRSWLNPCIGIL